MKFVFPHVPVTSIVDIGFVFIDHLVCKLSHNIQLKGV